MVEQRRQARLNFTENALKERNNPQHISVGHSEWMSLIGRQVFKVTSVIAVRLFGWATANKANTSNATQFDTENYSKQVKKNFLRSR